MTRSTRKAKFRVGDRVLLVAVAAEVKATSRTSVELSLGNHFLIQRQSYVGLVLPRENVRHLTAKEKGSTRRAKEQPNGKHDSSTRS